MSKFKNVNTIKAVVIFLGLMLAITPLHSLGYIFLIAWASIFRNPINKNFTTVFSSGIFNTLILFATIMLVASFSWIFSLQIFNLIISVLFIAFILKMSDDKPGFSSKIDRIDVLSIVLSVSAPTVIITSFFLSSSINVGSIQLLTNGYDNIAHLSLTHTVYEENGYVYGPFREVYQKTISPLNSYPQGYHLISANIADGLRINVFKESSGMNTVYYYLLFLFCFYIIAVFTFSRAALSLLHSRLKKQHKGLNKNIIWIFTGSIGVLFIQFLVYWGSLQFGFSSYLATLAYIVLFYASIYLVQEKKITLGTIILISLLIQAITQTWLMPMPAIFISAFIALLINRGTIENIYKSMLLNYRKVILFSIAFFFIALVPITMQIFVQVSYNVTSTGKLVSTAGGLFDISDLLFVLLVIAGALASRTYLLSKRNRSSNDFLIVSLPLLFLSALVYLYQSITTLEAGYYYYKLAAIIIVVSGVFLPIALYELAIRYTKNAILIPIMSIAIIVLITIGTNQPLNSGARLFQRYSTMTVEMASLTADRINSDTLESTPIVALRSVAGAEDNLATYLMLRIPHYYNDCLYGPVYQSVAESKSLEISISEIDKCQKLTKQSFEIIVSNKTEENVRNLVNKSGNKNIVITKL